MFVKKISETNDVLNAVSKYGGDTDLIKLQCSSEVYDDVLKYIDDVNGYINKNSISSFADMMSPEDAAKYNKYWDDISKGLDTNTRIKLNQWDYRPDTDLYLKYKDVYDNPKYYDQVTGKINWPPNDGFMEGTKLDSTISEGKIFKRFGNNSGEFLGNTTDSFESRALAPHSEKAEIHYYKLTEDYEMTTGEVSAWFKSDGGAEQFVKYKPDGSKYTIKELEDAGILDDITDLVEKGDIKID